MVMTDKASAVGGERATCRAPPKKRQVGGLQQRGLRASQFGALDVDTSRQRINCTSQSSYKLIPRLCNRPGCPPPTQLRSSFSCATFLLVSPPPRWLKAPSTITRHSASHTLASVSHRTPTASPQQSLMRPVPVHLLFLGVILTAQHPFYPTAMAVPVAAHTPVTLGPGYNPVTDLHKRVLTPSSPASDRRTAPSDICSRTDQSSNPICNSNNFKIPPPSSPSPTILIAVLRARLGPTRGSSGNGSGESEKQ